jgi:DNA-binding XRE family transcriptional regulator
MNTNAFKVKRIELGLSQDDLADQTKINRARISMFENGVLKLKDDELWRLKKALNSDFSNPDF